MHQDVVAAENGVASAHGGGATTDSPILQSWKNDAGSYRHKKTPYDADVHPSSLPAIVPLPHPIIRFAAWIISEEANEYLRSTMHSV